MKPLLLALGAALLASCQSMSGGVLALEARALALEDTDEDLSGYGGHVALNTPVVDFLVGVDQREIGTLDSTEAVLGVRRRFLEIGFLLGLGIYDFARESEATSTAIMFLIFGALLAAYVFYVRARIASAAETVAAAAHSLLLMPSLLGFVFAWLAVSAVLIVVLILVASAAGNHSKLEETTHEVTAYPVNYEWSECEFVASDAANNALGWCYVVWCWMWYSGQHKRAKFPTSKAPFSAVFHSFRLIFGRAIISRNGLEAWMLFPERARAEHSR